MQTAFETSYQNLNDAQRKAVDMIEGPVLIIAGPGTGKTQLLSTRAAKIVHEQVAEPNNILCLTYTEAGATEMRQRMTRIMGPQGGEIAVHTFHGFGSWLISQYSESFNAERSLKPLDELTRYSLVSQILATLPFRHQLAVRDENERFIRQHSVEAAIRAFKEAGLGPDEARSRLQANEQEYAKLQPLLTELFEARLTAKRLNTIAAQVDTYRGQADPGSYSEVLLSGLAAAVETAQAAGKTTALGAWRTSHTTIKDGSRVLKSAANRQLLLDTIKIYEAYQDKLAKNGRYDYEDMIIWAIKALSENSDMQLDIAERFQYIMVDEYQDTNGAQNRLLDIILKANPVNSPNCLVVGDDDQAIMRFQGAEVSGMLQYVQTYQPRVIVLKDNYRSSQQILDASRQLITQSDERLEVSLSELDLTKQLTARTNPPETQLQHQRYASQSAQYEAVAGLVETWISDGVEPNQIGIIGRKHAELSSFVPHLSARGITVSYDRRESILEDPAVLQLLQLAQLVVALGSNSRKAESLLPAVISADYWQLPPLEIYRLAAIARSNKTNWLDTMLEATNTWKHIAEWLLAAAQAGQTHNFTQMLDILMGREALSETQLGVSPFAHIYGDRSSESYFTILAHLLRLREAVLEHRPAARGLQDLLDVVAEYRRSDIRLIDDNPLLRGDSSSVQITSAHSAKGREFERVIILSAIDEVWGSKARSNNQRIALPENMPLYPAGDEESDKIRLLYVAMTRAKSQLVLTSFSHHDTGKPTTPLHFIAFGEESDGWWQPVDTSLSAQQKIQTLEASWSPPKPIGRPLHQVLEPALHNYHLSATALRDFLDIRYAGPQATIERHVLKFPSAYTAGSALGTAVHRVLQQAQAAWKAKTPLSNELIVERLDEALEASGLSQEELLSARSHGHQFLPTFIAQFSQTDFGTILDTEKFLYAQSPNFNVPLSGAIDALAEHDEHTLRVIDYKTGKPPKPKWETTGLSDSKRASLHFYRQQLLFYKLLVDNSLTYRNKATVACAELVFAEPADGSDLEFIRLAITDFSPEELAQTERLIKVVYDRIMAADLPNTSQYSRDLTGIQRFEADLLNT